MNERDNLSFAIDAFICMGEEFEGTFGSDEIVRGCTGDGDTCCFSLEVTNDAPRTFMIYDEIKGILYLDREWSDYSVAEYAVALLVKNLAYGRKITIEDLSLTNL